MCKELKDIENFYKTFQQLNWINNDVIGEEIKYFLTENELVYYLKSNNSFGVVNYEEELMNSIIEWSGEGYYVSWSWGEDHIQRIDKAYNNLINDFNEEAKRYNKREIITEEIEKFLKTIN